MNTIGNPDGWDKIETLLASTDESQANFLSKIDPEVIDMAQEILVTTGFQERVATREALKAERATNSQQQRSRWTANLGQVVSGANLKIA